MHQLTSKYKFYLYLLFFIFFTSIFNFKFYEDLHDKFGLKSIKVSGLSFNEKKNIQNELDQLKNINIFYLTEKSVLEKLDKFQFIENIYVNKIIPSSLNLNISKTAILGKTTINGERFFIGQNGKLINSKYIFEQNNVASVFGDFKVEDFINLIKKLNRNGIRISSIKKYYYYKNKRWDLLFYNDQTLMLPSEKYEEAIKIYKKLLVSEDLINALIIDLRVSNQIIVTNKNE